MHRLFPLLLCGCLTAQESGSLLTRADFIENWKTSKEFTLAVANDMPEKFYRFKPNPAEMNFASLMVHIADSNRFRFAQISEDKTAAPAMPKEVNKAVIVDRLRDSFDYCIGRLNTLTDEQLKKRFTVDWFERPAASGSQILLGMYVHTAHHRAQAQQQSIAEVESGPGVLFASGLIAGGAICGIVLAAIAGVLGSADALAEKAPLFRALGGVAHSNLLAFGLFAALGALLYRIGLRQQ